MVARAIKGAEIQEPWQLFDIKLHDGTKLEVKQSAAAQTWSKERRSKPIFGVRASKYEIDYKVSGALMDESGFLIWRSACV